MNHEEEIEKAVSDFYKEFGHQDHLQNDIPIAEFNDRLRTTCKRMLEVGRDQQHEDSVKLEADAYKEGFLSAIEKVRTLARQTPLGFHCEYHVACISCAGLTLQNYIESLTQLQDQQK